ncbi:MAG: hypothetical protein ACO3K7_06890, partial [Candidatus Marinamargulisbacteria bacterium]
DSVNQFFLFLSIVILLMSGTAFGCIICSSIKQSSHEIHDLRYLGLGWRDIQQFYIRFSVKITSIIASISLVIGWLISHFAHYFVGRKLNLFMTWFWPQWHDALFILGVPSAGIIGITYLVLKMVNPNTLFTQKDHRITWQFAIQGVVFTITFLTIFLISSGVSVLPALGICLGIMVIFIILHGANGLFYEGLRRIRYRKSFQFTLAIHYANDRSWLKHMTFIAISVCLITIFGVSNYESSLKHSFNPQRNNQQLPQLFVMDLYQEQLNTLNTITQSMNDTSPIVRTRINTINGQTTTAYALARNIRRTGYLFREQNLSTRSTLYPSEAIISGRWFRPTDNIVEMSVEERFAKRLQLQLGDTVEFRLFGLPYLATVTSIRSVDWRTFKPNFFILIEPPHLDAVPKTWVSAVQTPPNMSTVELKRTLTESFPNIAIIDITQTTQKVLGFIGSMMLSIKIGALYCFVVGIILFILMGKLFTDIRRTAIQQLYWIGVSHTDIYRVSTIETLLLCNGLFLVSWLISQLLCWGLFLWIMPIPLMFNHWVAIIAWLLMNALSLSYTRWRRHDFLKGTPNV